MPGFVFAIKNWFFWYMMASIGFFLRLSILQRGLTWTDAILYLFAPLSLFFASGIIHYGRVYMNGEKDINGRDVKKLFMFCLKVAMTLFSLLNIFLLGFSLFLILLPLIGLFYDWYYFTF